MARKKNLERAIVLGLILSTSIYGSVSAATINVANFVSGKTGTISVTEDTIVTGDGRQNGDSDTIGNSLFSNVDGVRYNNTVTVSNGAALQFDNVALNNTVITSDGKLTINANIYGMKAGLYLDANVKANELIINATAAGAKGIYAYNDDRNNVNNVKNGDILIDVEKNVQVTSNADGIFTEAYLDNDIDINAAGLTVVTDSRGGIYNNVGTDNHIRVDVGAGTVSVTSGDTTGNYGSIINKNSGDTTINAGNIIVNADTSNGVYATDGTVNLNAQENNQINGQVGIKAEGGTVNVNAGNTNSITASNIGISATNGSVFVGANAADKLSNASTTITVTSDEDAYGVYGYEIGEGGKPININADVDVVSDKVEISVTGKNSSGSPTVAGVYFVNNAGETNIKAGNSGLTITVNSSLLNGGRGSVYGIHTQNTANSTFASSGDVNITSVSNELGNATGIYSANSIYDTTDNVINVSGKNVNVSATTVSGSAFGIQTSYQDSAANGFKNKVVVNADENVYITANNTSETGEGNSNGINVGGGDIEITAKSGSTVIKSLSDINNEDIGGSGIYVGSYSSAPYSSNAVVKSNLNNEIYAGNAVYTLGEKSIAKITSQKANNKLTTSSAGVVAYQGSNVELYANQGANIINADATGIIAADYYGIGENSKVNLVAEKNQITSVGYGIRAAAKGDVDLNATVADNVISVKDAPKDDSNEIITSAIFADTVSDVDLVADASNSIYANQTTITNKETGETGDYGTAYAVNALSGSSVDLAAGEQNYLLGAVYANGTGTNVDVKGKDGSTATNVVRSYTEIAGAGDINTTEDVIDGETNKFKDKRFISALYAEDGANIELTGENTVGTWAKSTDANTLERTVWAYSSDDKIGSSISFDGAVQIGTDSYSSSPNSADVAIAAGTATDLTKDKVDGFVNDPNAKRSTVTIEYDDFKNAEGNYAGSSYISGDILSAYAGQVDIKGKSADVGIKITGNLLAGNNGILNVDLGKGGVLLGRADDYGDAGVVNNGQAGEGNEHQEFFDPAFSSTIHKGGRVDLGMGAGSTWFVTGQSWITTIDTTKAKGDAENERAKVDLVTEYKDKDGSDIAAHALTVYEFKGDADFLMSLSGNRADTDMLYMKHADGNYRIMLDKDITTSDINQDYATGENYSGLRFATVGADSDVTFTVGSYDNGGAFNVEYEVGQDVYGSDETAHENEAYNGSKLDGGKPGDDMVDNFFGNNGAPVSDETSNEGAISTASANSIMLMSEEPETLAEETQANDTNAYNAINHKIIAVKGTELNDTGKTILNMSRANYSNAIYMDRLNKRLGEASYINSEEDEGMWVRIRHDRIGKDAAYRSQNTMYELGYDQKQECDNGERRVGMAIDYMHGDTGYDQIAGKGEIDRYGLWLYDTWMGDKGHYADYVAKWGHLSNDFEVYTMQNGDKVTGDYSNNVFSVSAEYGRKKDIGNDWYFEPQVQAQLARVTGADYTTNQGTKVSVDGINSLIGRAGFRLGKDFGEEKQSTVYIKADVLHEFLGDQDVRVLDKSSDNKWAGISYENEGTWYDVGFGFATQMSKNSYAFMDFEKSFGNDNDETYQINVGMQWSF